jgi:hypothetical protein
MTQPGSAFWTCAQCGGMGSVLDQQCPNCGARRASTTTASPPPTQVSAPTPTSIPAVTVVGGLTQVQQMAQRTCPHCGSVQSSFAWKCGQCAERMSFGPRPRTTPAPQRVVAIALAVVLGVIGAHHFYMGRRPLGYLSVALCWSGYPATLGFIDGVRMAFMSDAEFLAECA